MPTYPLKDEKREKKNVNASWNNLSLNIHCQNTEYFQAILWLHFEEEEFGTII